MKPRLTVLPEWLVSTIVVVLAAFCLAVLLRPLLVRAEDQAPAPVLFYQALGSNDQPVKLRLFDRPCTSAKVLGHVVERFKPRLRAGELLWGGRLWEICWLYSGGFVRSVDEEGVELSPPGIPAQLFRPETGV